MTRRTHRRWKAPPAPTWRSWAAASSACGPRSGSRSATRPATSSCWSKMSAAAGQRPQRRRGAVVVGEGRQARRPVRPRGGDPDRQRVRRRDRRDRGVLQGARIDADFNRGGYLWTATTEAQLGAWDSTVELLRDLGAPALELLEPAEVARRAGSPVHIAGVLDPSAATVQPAKLARGLRRVALELGVRIHEHSRVTPSTGAARPCCDAERRADRRPGRDRDQRVGRQPARAAHAAGRHLERHHPHRGGARAAGRDRLDRVRGDLRLAGDDPLLPAHAGRPRDVRQGRLGHRDGRASAGSFDRHEGRARDVESNFRRIYPNLADVKVEYDWCGPIDRSMHGLPIFGRLGGREHLIYGVGWSGNGVGPSVLGGKILASLALGERDEWSQSPFVGERPGGSRPTPSASRAHTSSAAPWYEWRDRSPRVGSPVRGIPSSRDSRRRASSRRRRRAAER